MKKHIAPLGLAALILTGCSAPAASPQPSAPSVESATTSSPTASATATAAATRSARGNLIKKMGQPAGFTSDDGGTQAATFVIKSIAPIKCTEPYAQPAKNGHFLAATVDLQTFPVLADSSSPMVMMQSPNWKFIASNGTTFNADLGGNSYGCIPEAEMIPGRVGPGEKVTGKIVFDVPATTGILAFGVNGGTDWEWVIPTK